MFRTIVFYIDLFESAIRRFYRDGLVVRANAIAYSILISIVPLLTIGMRFTNVNREELRFQLNSFFHLYGITGAEPILGILDEILGRSNAIAGIGVLFMIYAALNIFSYLEGTANHIFRVPSRGLLIRNSIFTSWLVVIPFAILVLITGLTGVQRYFSHPAIVDIYEKEGKLFLLRSDSTLLVRGNGEEEIPFLSRTDFQVPGRLILTDASAPSGSDAIASLKQEVGAPFQIEVVGETIYIAAQPNFLFFSQDGGQTWDFRVFQTTAERAAVTPRLAGMVAEKGRVLLLLTSGQGSRLIHLGSEYLELTEVIPFADVFHSIMKFDRYYLTARGGFRQSDDGIAWSDPRVVPGLSEMLSMIIPSGGDGWIAMTASGRPVRLDSLLRSSFPSPRLPSSSVLTGMRLSKTGNLFAFSSDGQVRLSLDAGNTWIRADLPGLEKGAGISDLQPGSDGFWIGTGDDSLYRYRIESIRMTGGDDAPVAVGTQIEKRLAGKWRPLIGSVLVGLLAFLSLNILITLSYTILPNTEVRLPAAWAGGLVTSLIGGFFTVLFRHLMPFFASTGFVYGVWVALPLGLMVLLFLIQFFVLGLVITRLIQTPKLVRRGSAVSILLRLRSIRRRVVRTVTG